MRFFMKIMMVCLLLFTTQKLRADLNFFERFLFSDKAYAKDIEVKAFIITQEQACAALCDPPQQPVQFEKKELVGINKYLFIQVRNTGKKHAWGTLACKVPSYRVPIKISIFDIDNPKKYNIYLIHLGLLGFLDSKLGPPEISIEWDELYTK